MGRRAVTVAVLVVYFAWVLAAAATNSVQEFGDTYRYLDYSILDIQNPGILASVVLQSAGSHTAGLWVQVVLSAVAWSLLALSVMSRLGDRWVSWVLGLAVLGLSLITPVWSWNTLLASESTAITCGVIWLAAGIWLSGAPTAVRAWGFAVASALMIVARPQLVFLVIVVALVAFAWFGRTTRRFATVGLALVPVLLSAAWGIFRLMALSGEPKYRLYFAMNNIVDKTSFREYAMERMPRCEPLEALLAGPQPWSDMFAFRAGPLIGACPESFLWLKGADAATLKWLVTSPGEAVGGFLSLLPSLILPVYSDGRALPGPLGSALTEGPAWWVLVVASSVIGVVLAYSAGFRWRARVLPLLGVLAVVAAAFMTALVIWSADGIEHDRHLQPLTTLTLVGCLVLPAILLAPRPSEVASTGESSSELSGR